MNELTIKQKAEAYDKAIEQLRDFYRDYDIVSGLIDVKEELANMFPEIKESKDEQIRQRIIHALHGDVLEMSEIKEAIAWLEKQAKKSVDKLKVSNELYEHIRNTYTCIYNACSPNTFTDMTNYLLTAARSAQSALDMIENQGETKLLDYDDFGFKPAIEATTEEKVDNANKVEPEFHNGDWVVCEVTGLVDQIKNCIENLSNHKYGYELTNGGYIGSDEVNNYHLWNIGYARHGNVLTLSYASKNYILIYKRLYEKGINIIMSVCCFYCVEENEYYDETDNFHVMNSGEIITPATNEQCALLFQKMKEAGYEWDAEKKELKKIEDELITDVEIPFGAKDSELEEVFYSIPNGFHAEIKDDKVVIKKGEKKYWSEEDEKYFKNVIDELVCLRNRNDRKYDYSEMTRLINWFKFLKDRVQPQVYKAINEHYELEEFAKIVRCNLTGISKAVQKLFEAKYLQLTGNKMYGGFKD